MSVALIIWILVAVASIVASAMISGTEIGCYSLNRVRLDIRADRTPPDAGAVMLRRELAHPDRLLATLLISNNLVNYVSALATTAIFEHSGLSAGAVAAVSSAVLTPILFVCAEALPKELFRVRADRWTPTIAPALSTVRLLLTVTGVLPLVRVLARSLERFAGLQGDELSDARQRVAHLLKEGAGHGVLSESQVTLVDRAMLLRGITVADEMLPWSSVRTLPADIDRERAIRLLGETAHTRIPILERSGRVVGILKQIDLFNGSQPLTACLLPPVRLRKTMKVREALLAIREVPESLGVVEDESGRPIGIVTAKDLVEPLTGELADL